MSNNIKSFTILLSSLFLFACGGGSSSIASPGEAGPLSDPTGTGGTGGASSSVLTGTCPESPFITNGSPVAGNTV